MRKLRLSPKRTGDRWSKLLFQRLFHRTLQPLVTGDPNVGKTDESSSSDLVR
jgi:hypothetical protein